MKMQSRDLIKSMISMLREKKAISEHDYNEAIAYWNQCPIQHTSSITPVTDKQPAAKV